MLDTFISRRSDRLVPFEKTVTEIRAPTDESVNLLKEFEEKAEAKLIASFTLPNNLFWGSVHLMETAGPDQGLCAITIYDMNGIRHTVRTTVNYLDRMNMNMPGDFILRIRDDVAKDIANSVLEKAFTDLSTDAKMVIPGLTKYR
jgi:hypothetical protein